jgi:hypothetical protein|uniref:Lipoprotein n=1 Tax=Desulfobacca acetoxidans TaxID=60893 RepID=A0A7C3V416_9BACT
MNKKLALMAAASLVLGGLLVLGCGESRQPYAGNYRSLEPYAGKGHVELELKENGEATWKLAQEGMSVKFKWRVEDGQLWFYTKEGGIIHANPTEGGQKLTVDMTGQWHPSCPKEYCIIFQRVKGGGS